MKRMTLFTACLLMLFVAASGSALTVKPLTVEKMAEKAEVIVHGTVLSAYSDMDHDQNRVYTYITIRANDYLKGKQRPRTFQIKVPGGVRGDKAAFIDGSADFYKNEEVMLFLARRADGSLFPISFFQGKFSIYEDVETQKRILISDATGMGRFFTQPRNTKMEGLEHGEKLFLDDVRERVRKTVGKFE